MSNIRNFKRNSKFFSFIFGMKQPEVDMLGPRCDRCVSETVLHWTVLIKDFSVYASMYVHTFVCMYYVNMAQRPYISPTPVGVGGGRHNPSMNADIPAHNRPEGSHLASLSLLLVPFFSISPSVSTLPDDQCRRLNLRPRPMIKSPDCLGITKPTSSSAKAK